MVIMKTRTIGRDGPEIPAIGLGAWPIGGGMGAIDDETAIATVRSAIDGGITLLDTAQAYRTSETILGKALQGGYRERCFLATKVSDDFSPDGIRRAMENSLKALQVDYVDLYQIHRWNPDYPVEASMEAMVRLRDEGKTRFIGVSNYNAEQMDTALKCAPFHSNQVGYNMFYRRIETEDIAYCERKGIGILAYGPLAKGLLTGRYRPGHQFSPDDSRSGFARFQGDLFASYLTLADRLKNIARDLNITMVQLAIAWALRLSPVSCVLVGAKNPDQVKEHIEAADVELDKESLDRIETILVDSPALNLYK